MDARASPPCRQPHRDHGEPLLSHEVGSLPSETKSGGASSAPIPGPGQAPSSSSSQSAISIQSSVTGSGVARSPPTLGRTPEEINAELEQGAADILLDDEQKLRELEARQDAEQGADVHNLETFGETEFPNLAQNLFKAQFPS